MSGLFGWLIHASEIADRNTLVSSTDTMRHRGPIDGGYELLSINHGRMSLGMGHRLLSTADSANVAAQPIWSADRRFCLIYDGDIDNHGALRNALTQAGAPAPSAGVADALIEAYRVWGDNCVSQIRGAFAFAIYDAVEENLFLARDAFGAKPLYFYSKDGDLVFASELEPLTRFPHFDRSVDWRSLDGYLLDGYASAEDTLFKFVRKLPPGYTALCRNGDLTLREYFAPPVGRLGVKITNFQEASKRLRVTLEQNVREQMQRDAASGLFLSGGLDSAAILALMSRHSSQAIKTYCATFDSEDTSEARDAADLARWFGADHVAVPITPDEFMANWDEAVLRRGAPIGDSADIAIMLLAARASRDVAVALTGEGADDLLGGHTKCLVERYAPLYRLLVPGPLHDLMIAPLMRSWPFERRRLEILAKALSMRGANERIGAWFGGMTRAERRALRPQPPTRPARFAAEFSGADSNLRRSLFFDQTSTLPGNGLERWDRMAMSASVETRTPFVDPGLATLVAGMTDGLLVRGGRTKAVLRDAMKDLLPRCVLKRPARSLEAPLAEWMRDPHKDAVQSLLASEASTTRRLLRRDALDALLGSHFSGERDNSRVIWSLMNLEKFIGVYRPDLGASRDDGV